MIMKVEMVFALSPLTPRPDGFREESFLDLEMLS